MLAGGGMALRLSAFGAAEFAAIVSRLLRTGTVTRPMAEAALTLFDAWRAANTMEVAVAPEDHAVAAGFVRRFETKLAAPDALHLAIAQRLGLPLLTFDTSQAAAALSLGIACDPAGATGGA
jgi:predicted nucleic acid-binding protein